MQRYTALLLLLLSWLAPLLSRADAPVEQVADVALTSAGRWLVDGGLSGYWSNDAAGTPWRQHHDWLVTLTPSATYFVLDHIGVGVSAGGSVSHTAAGRLLASDYFMFEEIMFEETRRRAMFWGGHFVFDIPLGERFSLLTRISAGWGRTWGRIYVEGPAPTQQEGIDGEDGSLAEPPIQRVSGSYNADFVRAGLALPLVFHLSRSLGIGLGPELLMEHVHSQDVPWYTSSEQRTEGTGLRTRLGMSTWLGGSF